MKGTKSPMDGEFPVWQYDELKHAGVDYADTRIAKDYDAQHGRFRDYEKEAQRIAEWIELTDRDTVVDLGCGTGGLALPLARLCRKVYAVDVSRAMLEHCAAKAAEAGLENVETQHAGFLTYRHGGEPVDAVISVAALHHLPDFWKAVALRRVHDLLKPGGRFYLFDVVFSFDVEGHRSALDAWIETMRPKVTASMLEEAIVHIRDEFSTFDWALEGMLERVGFAVEAKYTDVPNCIAYLCNRR